MEDREIPISQRCNLLDLTEDRCYWPVGDPLKPDFFFCGGKTDKSRGEACPYCRLHAEIAGWRVAA
jgi:GcrA cell cycle regulator